MLKKIIIASTCAVVLVGCQTRGDAPTQEQAIENAHRCASYYRAGTPEYADCLFTLDRDTRVANFQNRQAQAQAFRNLGQWAQNQQMINNMNRPRTCSGYGNYITCW